MATRAQEAAEAYRRGLMGPNSRAEYEEAVRRGIVKDAYAEGRAGAKRGFMGAAGAALATVGAAIPGVDEAQALLISRARTGADLLSGRVKLDPKDPNASLKRANDEAWRRARQEQAGARDQYLADRPVAANLFTGLGFAAQAAPMFVSGGATVAPQVSTKAANLFQRGKDAATWVGRQGTTGAAYAAANAAAGSGNASERTKAANEAVIPGFAAGVAAPLIIGAPGAVARGPAGRTVVRTANRAASYLNSGKGFLDPNVEAFRRVGEKLKADKFTADEIQQAFEEWTRVGGPSPAFMDLISRGGRGQQTMALFRGAALTGGGRTQAATYGKQTAVDLQDNAIARTRQLTPEQRPAADVAAGLRAERANAANVDYAAPYRTPVVVGDTINDALSGEPGRAALRRARSAAVARRNTEQVAEIDALLAADPPAGGVVKLPPTIAPEAPLPVEDPRGRSLLTFLRQQGGLKDMGGDLKAMGLSRDRGRFQKDNIVNPNGIDLDDAAQRAWEAGYFPNAKAPRGADYADNYNPVSRDDLLEAIRREAAGQPPPASWLQEEDLAASTRWMDDAPDFPEFGDDWWRSLEGDGAKRVSAGTLDRVRIAMAGRGAKMNQSPDTRDIASGLFQRASDIDAALASVPEIAPARAAYKSASNKIEGVEKVGPGVLTSSPNLFAADVARLGPEAQPFVGASAARTLEDAIGRPTEGASGVLNRIGSGTNTGRNLEAAYGSKAAGDYRQAVNQIVDQLNNARFINPNNNSQSAGRLFDANLVDVPTPPKGWLNVVLSMVNAVNRGAAITAAEREALVVIATTKVQGQEAALARRALESLPPPRAGDRSSNLFAIPATSQENSR